ncbi:hypothetical protein ACW95P_04575 [Candidatus Mycoplasma pogonae]
MQDRTAIEKLFFEVFDNKNKERNLAGIGCTFMAGKYLVESVDVDKQVLKYRFVEENSHGGDEGYYFTNSITVAELLEMKAQLEAKHQAETH